MAVVDQLLRLYAQSIFGKAGALKALKLTRNQRKRLRDTITADLRACGALLYPEVRLPEVSKEALQEADRIGVNLWAQTLRRQKSFDRGRKVFHWEHVNPIACIQELCEAAKSEEAVLDALARLRVAWILKREDKELTRLGSGVSGRTPKGRTGTQGSFWSSARVTTANANRTRQLQRTLGLDVCPC